ncbi:hypothetical protein SESBI_44480 [Sesbania bispinosa]|nr:hypothetical protein SESBI_44480 [Sesbania bispinosa]
MWWKQKGVSFKRGLRELKNDEDAFELAAVAEINDNVNEEVHVHGVGSEELNDSVADNVNEEVPVHGVGSEELNDGEADNVNEEVPVHANLGQVEAEAESNVSVDSKRDVHFDDSEEERAQGADDVFNHAEVGQAETELNEKVNNMKGETSGVDRDGGNEGIRGNVGGFPPPNVENMYTIEEEYESEELLSGADSRCNVHKEVKFVKNDLVRARAVCTRKFPFTVLCSKVGGTKTFRIKTLHGRHMCGRVFNNKHANSKWIAKVVVDKFMTSSNVKLTEIIEDVQKNYGDGISEWNAWKARLYARNIVNGDANQQYTLL